MVTRQKTLKRIEKDRLAEIKDLSKTGLTVVTCYKPEYNNFFLLEMILKSTAEKFKNEINFFFCPIKTPDDITILDTSAQKFPVTILLKNGKVSDLFWGVLPKHKIVHKIEEQLQIAS
jgi:hypothetical protein